MGAERSVDASKVLNCCAKCKEAWNAEKFPDQELPKLEQPDFDEACKHIAAAFRSDAEKYAKAFEPFFEVMRKYQPVAEQEPEKQDNRVDTTIRTDSNTLCHSCGKKTRSSLHLLFSDGESEVTAIVCPTCISTMNQKLMLAMAGHIEGEA